MKMSNIGKVSIKMGFLNVSSFYQCIKYPLKIKQGTAHYRGSALGPIKNRMYPVKINYACSLAFTAFSRLMALIGN